MTQRTVDTNACKHCHEPLKTEAEQKRRCCDRCFKLMWDVNSKDYNPAAAERGRP